MKAIVFPGQASQFVGMGKDLLATGEAQDLVQQANAILGFDIGQIMVEGSAEDLQETSVTQPAVFIHSVVKWLTHPESFRPDFVAGHSLGEFSALVGNKVLSFEDGLKLVKARAAAMQKACDEVPGTMAAIVGLDDETVEDICERTKGVVVPANYNCPGQLVISGEYNAVSSACENLKEAGAKRAIMLSVGGAFHSPLMLPAQNELAEAIELTSFNSPLCPIIQNVDGQSHTDAEKIKKNLILQLTAPVRWTDAVTCMIDHGTTEFIEVGGSGRVLQGMIRRISRESTTATL